MDCAVHIKINVSPVVEVVLLDLQKRVGCITDPQLLTRTFLVDICGYLSHNALAVLNKMASLLEEYFDGRLSCN